MMRSRGGIAHWDDVESGRAELEYLGGTWRDLGRPGSVEIGVQRIEIDPGKWSTPVHLQTAEEEIFYVLGGSGISLQEDEAYEVRPGDCLVHLASGWTHTLRAGKDGLDVLAFGMRATAEIGHLPRARVAWIGHTWTDVGGSEHPWKREVAAGEPEVPEPSARPDRIVNADEVEGEYGGARKGLGEAAGSRRTGLNLVGLPAGEEGAPAHCHSADEEIFIVLEGGGTLTLIPSPQQASGGVEEERHEVRAGHVIARPAGTGIAHLFTAGDDGLTMLAYGTREPSDVAYYPRSNKFFFRGLGLIGRVEPLDYFDGEPG
jgi:uncharacterized cupin superfamily protein